MAPSFLKGYILPLAVSMALVVMIDAFTNSVPREMLFDSKVYIGMSEYGFERNRDRLSPFVYRYAGPFLAGGIHRFTGLSIETSFRALTYLGAISLLLGIFLLVRYLTRSEKGAYAGMIFVAFSLYSIKYPLYDIFRPDILAYPLILLCTWLALTDRFLLLVLTTMIGLQFREFTIVPLIAYLAAQVQYHRGRALTGKIIVSFLALLIAVGIPRLVIPVEGHMELVEFSRNGIGQALQLLLVWARNVNIVYIVLAYFLPVLILFSWAKAKNSLDAIPRETASYFVWYSLGIFLLLFVAGTDTDRFATYFFLPMAVLVGYLVKEQASFKILLVVAAIQFVFNRIWLPFPVSDLTSMIDFYGGYFNVIDTASLWRFAELAGLVILGRFIVHFPFSANQTVPAGK